MHLLQEYAKTAGVKIDKPSIYEDYFPLTHDKYITIHTTSKPAKTYHWWQEVVYLIKPELDKLGISILQIGHKDDLKLGNVNSALGQTTINQTAYILKNSMLHVGVDSFPVHVASGYGRKIVALYSNNFVECVCPYWSKKEDFIALTSYTGTGKPLFALEDPEMAINKIKPEDIAGAVFKLLGIEKTFNYRTVFIGAGFNKKHIESVPDSVISPEDKNAPLVIRMDYDFNQENMDKQISSHPHCYLVTNKPFKTNILLKARQNVKSIEYRFRKDYDIEFAKELNSTGIPFKLTCELPEEGSEQIKFDFMDVGVVDFEKVFDYKDASEFKDVNFDNLYYKTCKILSARQKQYYGRNAWANNDPLTVPGEWKKAKNSRDLWMEADYTYFIEKL